MVAAADPNMSASQRELVEIMERVKSQDITQAKADNLFQSWKIKHEGKKDKNFREKLVGTYLLLQVFTARKPLAKSHYVVTV